MMLKCCYSPAVVFILTLVLGAANATAQKYPPLQSVDAVDLSRYLGVWYQIANTPNWFQKKCISDTSATYTRSNDGAGIEVLNACRTQKGIEEANGYARIVDHESNSKLEVSFFSILGWRPVWGDYWIIDLAEDYSWVIVGEPGRKYAWILARTQTLEPNLQQQLEQRLADQGYDISSLQRLPHAAAPDTR